MEPNVFPHVIIYISFPENSKSSPGKTPKKVKVEEYKLTREQKTLIKNDTANKKLWDEAMQSLSLGPVRIQLTSVSSLKRLFCDRWKGLNALCVYRNS